MDSRQRVCTVLRGGIPDRVPYNFWMDRDAMARYDAKYGADFRLTHYDVDVIEAFHALDWWPTVQRETVLDAKTVWQVGPAVGSIQEALALPLPDVTDPAVYAPIRAVRAAHPDKAIFVLILSPFEHLFANLRLQAGTALDLYDHPEQVHHFLAGVAESTTELVRRTCELDVDVIYLAGDLCATKGPMLSCEHLEEFCFRYLVEPVRVAHEADLPVLYHTDGRVMEILDLFVKYGFQGINPLQPHLNDLQAFAREYGDELVLYGGLDNCYTIPDGTIEGIRKHVRGLFHTVGAEGGLIMSSHDIPGYTQEAKIEAMIAEIRRCVYT